MMGRVHCTQPAITLLAGNPRNSGILGAQYLYLMSVEQAYRSSCSHITVHEWKYIQLSPCMTTLSDTMASIMGHWTMTGTAGGRGDYQQKSSAVYFITELMLCWNHLEMSLCMIHCIFTFFDHLERPIYILLPQMSFSLIFQSCSFQVPKHLSQPMSISHESEYDCTSNHSCS